MEKRYLHGKIVKEILPRFAQKLKQEAVISDYDCNPFTLSIAGNWTPIKINPDLVVHLANGEKVLIEIASPRDPKRFLGEMVYPQFLAFHKKIAKVIIFVLHNSKNQGIHDRGFQQKMVLGQFFSKYAPTIMMSWNRDETVAYHNLKCILLEHFPPSKGLRSKHHE